MMNNWSGNYHDRTNFFLLMRLFTILGFETRDDTYEKAIMKTRKFFCCIISLIY